MDIPEIAVSFRDVAHFGIEYTRKEGGSINLGRISETGEFHFIAGFMNQGYYEKDQAIKRLQAEISPTFALISPKIVFITKLYNP